MKSCVFLFCYKRAPACMCVWVRASRLPLLTLWHVSSLCDWWHIKVKDASHTCAALDPQNTHNTQTHTVYTQRNRASETLHTLDRSLSHCRWDTGTQAIQHRKICCKYSALFSRTHLFSSVQYTMCGCVCHFVLMLEESTRKRLNTASP